MAITLKKQTPPATTKGTSTTTPIAQSITSSELDKRVQGLASIDSVFEASPTYTVPSSRIGYEVTVVGPSLTTILLPDPTSGSVGQRLLLTISASNVNNATIKTLSNITLGTLTPGTFAEFELVKYGTDPLSWRALTNDYTTLKVNSVTVIPTATNKASYYKSVDAANIALGNSSTINDLVLIRDYATSDLSLNRSATYNGYGATIGKNTLLLLPYPGSSTAITQKVQGINTNGRVVAVKQRVGSTLIIEDFVFNGASWFELFGLGLDDLSITDVTLIRCRGVRSLVNGGGIGNQNGNIVYQLRSDYGQIMNLTLIDCDFTNTLDSVFTGYIHPDARIYLKGKTKLTPKSGEPVAKLIKIFDGSSVDPSTIIIDQRDATSGGTPPVATIAIMDAVKGASFSSGYTNTIPSGSVEGMAFSAADATDSTKTWYYLYGRKYDGTLSWQRTCLF